MPTRLDDDSHEAGQGTDSHETPARANVQPKGASAWIAHARRPCPSARNTCRGGRAGRPTMAKQQAVRSLVWNCRTSSARAPCTQTGTEAPEKVRLTNGASPASRGGEKLPPKFWREFPVPKLVPRHQSGWGSTGTGASHAPKERWQFAAMPDTARAPVERQVQRVPRPVPHPKVAGDRGKAGWFHAMLDPIPLAWCPTRWDNQGCSRFHAMRAPRLRATDGAGHEGPQAGSRKQGSTAKNVP